MNFLIDYDTRSVECKSADAEPLQKYIQDNDLGLAVALISGEDDLEMEMSLAEVSELFHNISERSRKFETEEEAAEVTYALLQGKADQFPDFTPALGKKLLKAGQKRSADTAKGKAIPATKTASKTTTESSKPAKRSRTTKASDDTVFVLGSKQPRPNTIHHIITSFIDDNMGEATFKEIVDNFVETYTDKEGNGCDEKFATGYVKGAIRKAFIEEQL